MKKLPLLILAIFCLGTLAMAQVPTKPGAQVVTKKKVVVTKVGTKEAAKVKKVKVKKVKKVKKEKKEEKGAKPAIPAIPAVPAIPPKK